MHKNVCRFAEIEPAMSSVLGEPVRQIRRDVVIRVIVNVVYKKTLLYTKYNSVFLFSVS
jgi:hypothetical protein